MHTGAIPKELVASELFGHEKGAFTGAMNSADGKFAVAEKGTLFLDEVGTMDIPTQISLLRVLETYRYNRVGASRERAADVRIVAATNSDLLDDVKERRFREDLYYRLNVLTIALPPLRERAEDIVPLAEHFLTAACKRFEVTPKKLSSAGQGSAVGAPRPGNVRELRNAMDQVAVFANGPLVDASELELLRHASPHSGPSTSLMLLHPRRHHRRCTRPKMRQRRQPTSTRIPPNPRDRRHHRHRLQLPLRKKVVPAISRRPVRPPNITWWSVFPSGLPLQTSKGWSC